MINKEEKQPSQWAKWEAFFFNQGANISFLAMMMVINIGMATWGAWEFTEPHWKTKNDVLRVTLPIARASGRLVTWNSAVILITASKLFWTCVRRTPIQLGFPVDNIMPYYHRIVALTIIFMGCVVHTIPQVINYATQELKIKGGPVWLWGDGLATKQLLITGILLFFVFACFYITTLQKVRRTATGFRIFWWAHLISITCAGPLLLMHGTIRGTPITLCFTAFPLALYCTDIILRRCLIAVHPNNTVKLRVYQDKDERVTKIVLQNKNFRYSPGQYAELKIPAISKTEWHPFTIASAPTEDGEVIFYVKAVGRWTTSLFELAERESSLTDVGVRGPFGAPAQNYLAYRHIVVIGSGIGVTPLLSVWNHLVNATTALGVDPDASQYNFIPKKQDDNSSSEQGFTDDEMSDDGYESRLLDNTNMSHMDVVAFDRPLATFRGRMAYYASIMESMTVNICLFIFSMFAEVLVFGIWIYNLDKQAANLQVAVSVVGLLVFGSKFFLSLFVYGGRYAVSMVFLLESSILCTDLVALGASLGEPSRGKAIAYFAFYCMFILLHGIRIFHIFYSTARPPVYEKQPRGANRIDRIKSVTGIWVSRHYSSMSFAVSDLVNTVEHLSSAFSLQLFATRDKKAPAHLAENYLQCGRPDWESILSEAIERAHNSSHDEGEPVGVFFCGSPAIASTLQRVAQHVTAKHQDTIRRKHKVGCKCRILVHKENF